MVVAPAASTVCSAATRVFREPTIELITVPAMPTAATPPVIQAAVMIRSTSGTLPDSTESRPAARRHTLNASFEPIIDHFAAIRAGCGVWRTPHSGHRCTKLRAMAGSYVKVGRGDHRVIALHGWFGSALGWGTLTDYLNTAQFSYVFPDLRGYGSRRDEAGEFTMAEAAADALGLADALGWDRFSLVGHSMSGVAMQHVLLQAPYRVRRLVGVAPVPATGLPLGESEWS